MQVVEWAPKRDHRQDHRSIDILNATQLSERIPALSFC